MAAGAIGVADLDKSQAFYGSVFGMELRYALPVPNYVDERVLYFKDNKGADVVLMHFTDGMPNNYENNPVRLVFFVVSATATVEAVRAQGLAIIREPSPEASFNNAIIGFGLDPDGYGLEIIEEPDLAGPYLGAIGIGVSDLDNKGVLHGRAGNAADGRRDESARGLG
jgi:catechol 2,3-dioxygenase-like lactoylglutathione lyase family enzyme